MNPQAGKVILHRAAVLGSPIEHSLSPVLHNAGYAYLGLGDWEYGRFECTAEALPGFLAQADSSYAGFSVTMPAKFAALECADEITERARLVGSVNTLVRTASGWRADNTDVLGVKAALGELGAQPGPVAVVIGGGGTARPAMVALAELGAQEIVLINRSDKSAELAPLADTLGVKFRYVPLEGDVAGECAAANVVVSTVPSAAIEDRAEEIATAPLLDVIYDPWPTPLVTAARRKGIPAVGGHAMLAGQAYSQFEQFTGRPAPREAMRAALDEALGITP